MERKLAIGAAQPERLDYQQGANKRQDDGASSETAVSGHYRCHVPLWERSDRPRQIDIEWYGVRVKRLIRVGREGQGCKFIVGERTGHLRVLGHDAVRGVVSHRVHW